MTQKSLTLDDLEGQYLLLWLNGMASQKRWAIGQRLLLISTRHSHLLPFGHRHMVGPP